MGFDNGSIYARGESEIVGVDDETTHAKSLAGEDPAGTVCGAWLD
jgi:hypothetical protein